MYESWPRVLIPQAAVDEARKSATTQLSHYEAEYYAARTICEKAKVPNGSWVANGTYLLVENAEMMVRVCTIIRDEYPLKTINQSMVVAR